MLARLSRVAAILLAGGMTSVPTGANPAWQQVTFRAQINYVEVDAIVTDASGNFVPGLTAADFELFEDGQPQAIEAFHEINVPIERGDRTLYSDALVHPDVASNEAVDAGRIYLLVLDDLHVRPDSSTTVRRTAREFVERYVGSNDLVAVIHTSGRADVTQEFTSNRALALRAIDGFLGRGLNSAVMNRIEAYKLRSQDGRGFDPSLVRDHEASQRVGAARASLETVSRLATYLASLSGRRKALLLFSEGIDFDSVAGEGLEGPLSEMQDARSAMLDAIGAATRANVHVYAIDATGASSSGVDAEFAFLPSTPEADALGLNIEALTAERRNMRGTLRTIAEQTGGAAIVDTNNLAGGLARIVRENSTYYLLGYSSPSKPDGRFHQIDVRLKRPGLSVRARDGYHAAKTAGAAPASDDPLSGLLSAAVPSPGLPMRLAVPTFRHTPALARVWMAIDVPAEGFRFEDRDGVAAEDLLVTYQLIEPGGKIAVSSREQVQMRLRPDSRAAVERLGFRLLFPLEVQPGRYQVRVAARSTNGARQGSVFTDLDVPDFFNSPLTWSSVALTSASQVRTPTRPSDPALAQQFPLMPAAMRTFPRGDTLGVYAELYDNGSGAARAADITAVVRDDTGRAVFTTSEQGTRVEPGQVRAGEGFRGFRAEIRLAGLPPGSYVLTLSAASSGSGDAPSTRDIPFTIGIS